MRRTAVGFIFQFVFAFTFAAAETWEMINEITQDVDVVRAH